MKLRNKKTGEIKKVIVGGYPVSGKTEMWECSEMDMNEETGYKTLGIYTSLAELNAEWEDYEEPKKYWFIDCGTYEVDECEENEDTEVDKQIGNYFETREEAEKAVEKLKAITRLKSCGFKFKGWRTADLGADKYYFVITAESDGAGKGDLDLLFGGEE